MKNVPNTTADIRIKLRVSRWKRWKTNSNNASSAAKTRNRATFGVAWTSFASRTCLGGCWPAVLAVTPSGSETEIEKDRAPIPSLAPIMHGDQMFVMTDDAAVVVCIFANTLQEFDSSGWERWSCGLLL